MKAPWKRSKKNNGPKATARRIGALHRIEQRLVSDVKSVKDAEAHPREYSSSFLQGIEKEVKRKNKEIAILKERTKNTIL